MLGIYSFVFTVVFQARFGAETGAKGEFAIILFSGLILHSLLSEILARSPMAIIENANFVKKVIFPLQILSPVIVLTALFQFFISFLVLVFGVVIVYGSVSATILYMPIVILPFILMCCGFSYILASLGVYIRDVAHIMGLLITILLFFSTIFYPASALPIYLQWVIYLNPLSFIVDQFRNVVVTGDEILWGWYVLYSFVSCVIFYFGFWFFQKARRGFADVL